MRNPVVEEDLDYIISKELEWDCFKNKTILITGATGFLAYYMAEVFLYLNEKRNYNIKIILLIGDIKKAQKRFSHSLDSPFLIFKIADLNDINIEIEDELDYIIHAASNATPKFFGVDPVGTILPNVIGTQALLKLAYKNKVECFLYFSTTGVYGHVNDDDYPIKENCFGGLDSMDVASCYIESKRLAETLCVSWAKQYGTNVKVVRPAITYGPGIEENDGRSFADFMWSIARKKDIELYSDGLVKRNFCYIADAVSGFFYVLLKGEFSKAYNVASEEDITIKDLAKKLTNEVFKEKNLKVVFKNKSSKNFLRKQFSRTTVDTSRVKALGWTMEYSIEDGFKRCVRSITLDLEKKSNN